MKKAYRVKILLFLILETTIFTQLLRHSVVVVAEWLRRWTRNPLGSPRAGSNPADYEELFSNFLALISKCLEMMF